MYRVSTTAICAATLSLALSSTVSIAQEDMPDMYAYATYSMCDLSKQDRADEIVQEIEKPIYDKAVDDGEIAGWGWWAHHTGGQWRRLHVHLASSQDALIDAQQKISERLEKANAQAGDEMAKICHSHDDYIWKFENGSPPKDQAGDVMFSAYMICEEARETRADEIMNTNFAPILNRYVEENRISSWAWLSHRVGGKYRRIQTITAPDAKTVLKVRDALIDDLYPEGSTEAQEFAEICDGHTDYIWYSVAGK